MLEVENFLDQNTFNKFLHLSEQVDKISTTPCIKTNWYYDTDGEHGVSTRFFESGPSNNTELNSDFDNDLQFEIYSALKSFLGNYKDKIQEVGKNIVVPNFKINHIKSEFQYTDVLKAHKKHRHNEDLIGTIYISPEIAKGTVFLQKETYVVPWKPNKCSFHTKDIIHFFENDMENCKRFTINFFVTGNG